MKNDKELPRWILATERQPPDGWHRPVILAESYGWHVSMLRYSNGKWWAMGQLKEESVHDNKIKYWMELYPLPNGDAPPV